MSRRSEQLWCLVNQGTNVKLSLTCSFSTRLFSGMFEIETLRAATINADGARGFCFFFAQICTSMCVFLVG